MKDHFYYIASGGVRCALHALGASVASVEVRDAGGNFTGVALAPLNFRDGAPDPSLAGRTVGPCCGRVRDGRIDVDGRAVQLALNEGANHIHGGPHGCALSLWEGQQLSPRQVRFELALPDGLDGYPGARRIRVEYAVEDDCLTAVYTATTDRPTWLGLTNHVYWDLSGRFDGSALDQRLELAARRVVFNGEGHLPLEVVPAEGAFDFSRPAALRDNLRRDPAHGQLALGRGYNNAYLIDPALRQSLGWVARLHSPESGIRMTLETDQPAVVLYSGGFLDGATALESGGATPGCAVALEAQHVPDPFHLPGARPEYLTPDSPYRRTIRWRFDVLR